MADDTGDPGNIDQYLQMQDLINQLGPASANQEKTAALNKQLQLAMALRGGPDMPRGIQTRGDHGGVYVAPNALQDLAAGSQYVIGGLAGQKAINDQMGMAGNEAINRQKIMAMLLSQGGQHAPMQGVGDQDITDATSLPNVNAPPQDVAPGGTSQDQILRMIYPNLKKKVPGMQDYGLSDYMPQTDQAGNPVQAIGPT